MANEKSSTLTGQQAVGNGQAAGAGRIGVMKTYKLYIDGKFLDRIRTLRYFHGRLGKGHRQHLSSFPEGFSRRRRCRTQGATRMGGAFSVQ